MIRILISVFAIALMTLTATASSLNGPTILTITGNISNTNRESFDEFSDAFFSSHDVEFENAYSFNLKALEALGTKSINVSYPDWPKTYKFEGPLLSDILKAASSKGRTLVVRALDGYAPEIPMADVEKYPIILAIKRDGEYLGLGGRGPSWVIYPRDDFTELTAEDDSKFVWSVYHIEVR